MKRKRLIQNPEKLFFYSDVCDAVKQQILKYFQTSKFLSGLLPLYQGLLASYWIEKASERNFEGYKDSKTSSYQKQVLLYEATLEVIASYNKEQIEELIKELVSTYEKYNHE